MDAAAAALCGGIQVCFRASPGLRAGCSGSAKHAGKWREGRGVGEGGWGLLCMEANVIYSVCAPGSLLLLFTCSPHAVLSIPLYSFPVCCWTYVFARHTDLQVGHSVNHVILGQ